MANDLDGSPYKIDTAGVVFEKPILVKQMVWQEPAVAGENLVVLDLNGRVLWDENAYAQPGEIDTINQKVYDGEGTLLSEKTVKHFADGSQPIVGEVEDEKVGRL